MPRRTTEFAPGEIYHLCGRGNEQQRIFRNKRDYARFIFACLHGQSDKPIFNASKAVTMFLQKGVFPTKPSSIADILNNRVVEVLTFALMPNHYHLMMREVQPGGVSQFMLKVLTAHSKYFNTKYNHSGHVFEGPFRAMHVADDRYAMHLAAYIHKNPSELAGWEEQYDHYQWSSMQDYVYKDRWGGLLHTYFLAELFEEPEKFLAYTRRSTAKETEFTGFEI